jgi:hypothetical protein
MSWEHELAHEKATPKPVTLPIVKLDDIDIEREAKEAAQRIAERRVVRNGRDAWEAINKAQSSFEGWLAVGKALLIGREVALKSTGANAPMGRRYCLALSQWLAVQGFTGMQKSVRSVAIELAEHANAITIWRDGLPERQRRRLIHPLSVTRRWRACTKHNGGQCPQDLKRDAIAALRKFVWCMRAMPAHEVEPLRRIALAEIAAMIP